MSEFSSNDLTKELYPNGLPATSVDIKSWPRIKKTEPRRLFATFEAAPELPCSINWGDRMIRGLEQAMVDNYWRD